MQNQFALQPNLTEIQSRVFQIAPNIIVSGCAGSGKTLLACHIAMRHSKSLRVAILVFTKSLRAFIRDYIDSYGENKVSVLYEHEWRARNFPKYEIIIVDEFQDFSTNDITNVIANSSNGVYLFGDTEQKLYAKNFQHEPTLNIDELITNTNFEHINLTDNFRVSEENKNLISALYENNSLRNSNYSTGCKPKIQYFESIGDELNWIKDFLISNTEFKNIGILIKQNDGFIGGYHYRRKLRKDKIYGIVELKEFFEKYGINIGYKYKNDDHLVFSNDTNINIMTYHSSKGLQFDCVILPFSNYVNENNGATNLPYVGLTRATKQIIITYSGLVAEEYSVPIPHSTYEGKIQKRSIADGRSLNDKIQDKSLLTFIKGTPNYDKIKEKIVQKEDISDCKIVKY